MAEGDPNIPPRRQRDDDDRPRVCEFCKCALSRRGEVLKKSAEAKAFQAAEEAVERLTAQLATKDTKIAELEAAIVELRRQPEPEPPVPAARDRW